MGCVIDTCVIINSERDKSDLIARISKSNSDSFYISVISASELLFGIHRAQTPETKNRRKAFVEEVLLKFPILPNDLTVARMHAEIWAELTIKGKPIGAHDMWIAATCLANGHALVTENIKDFSRIPGLEIL